MLWGEVNLRWQVPEHSRETIGGDDKGSVCARQSTCSSPRHRFGQLSLAAHRGRRTSLPSPPPATPPPFPALARASKCSHELARLQGGT